MRKKYKILFSFLSYIMFSAYLHAEGEIIDLEADKSILDIDKEIIKATERVTVKYENIKIHADQIEKLENRNVLKANGNVIFLRDGQVIRADEIVYDMDTQKAQISESDSFDTNIKLRFGGQETESVGTSRINIYKGWVTTSPYKKPNYKVEADELIIYPNRKLIARNMGINIGGKTLFKLPYYVTSLKLGTQRATLFPFLGRDSDRGNYITWGFDYEKGNLAQGFVDFEVSEKNKLTLKWSNDYKFPGGNSGNIFLDKYIVPFKNNEKQWDIKWTHTANITPKKDKIDREFWDLGYGIWNLGYQNQTTNLMTTVDGEKLKDTQTDYLRRYKNIGFYDIKINQELGRNGEFNFDYYWTQDRKALRELTRINDDIVYRDDLNPVNTDIDLFRRLKYFNGNSDIGIKIETEDFFDVNPGYVGDYNSYRILHSYEVDLKGPKIKLGFVDSDKDEYGSVFGMKERDDDDPFLFENRNDRWVEKVAYDKKKEWNLTFGNYYLFRKNDFFGYKPKTISEYLLNNMYFGLDTKHVELKKKEYEYDYTRDNNSYNIFFNESLAGRNLTLYNDDRIYKIYENSEYAKRAKKIIDESYASEKITIGNDNIALPLKDSFIAYSYGLENRNYKSVYVPDFSGEILSTGEMINIGRKLEEESSKTGYKIRKDVNGNDLKRTPQVTVNTIDTRLFTTLFDNTYKTNNKYDLKITSDTNLNIQKTTAKNAMYDGYDIIETPTNAIGINNNFKASLGNINLQYYIVQRDDKHFKDNWLKNSYNRNYIKIDIDNNRFVSANLENDKRFEIKDVKDVENTIKEFQHGYKSEKGNNFLYRYSENVSKYYPYNEILGWSNNKYKEKNVTRNVGFTFNEWRVDYYKYITQLNDLFSPQGTLGSPLLKSKLDGNTIAVTYNTKDIKNRESDINHLVRVGLGTGKKTYRYLNGTPVTMSDDIYATGKDYTNVNLAYRVEKNVKPVIEKKETEEVEDRTSLYNLKMFYDKTKNLKNITKYFQVEMNFQLDGTSSIQNTKLKGLEKINDFGFKIEAGHTDKYFGSYKFISERPDGIFRNDPNRKSRYNYRRHDFEAKYNFSKDEDKSWWIGASLQYVQNGSPKASDPEIYESSNNAVKVNKITQGLVTLTHIVENVQWEVGAGMKWDKPDNKKLGYYPVVSIKFTLIPFPEKSIGIGYEEGSPKFGIGF